MTKRKAPLDVTHMTEASADSLARFIRGDTSMLRCTLCNKAGGCGCWSKCGVCGWSFETGKECRNCEANPPSTRTEVK